MIYHSLFHTVMTYGIIFWENSSHSIQVFRMQKKAIRVIMWRDNRESCRNLFKELKILPLMTQYILYLLTFVSNNRDQYFKNSEIHNVNTFTIKELIIQVLRFSVVFQWISKYTLIIQEHLKRQ